MHVNSGSLQRHDRYLGVHLGEECQVAPPDTLKQPELLGRKLSGPLLKQVVAEVTDVTRSCAGPAMVDIQQDRTVRNLDETTPTVKNRSEMEQITPLIHPAITI
jgi:hypothetical protein